MTCREAIEAVFRDDPGVLSTADVISRIYAMHPDEPWQRNTISAHLIGLSVNHSSSHHYPSFRRHAFLFSLGGGRYRKWYPETDGTWEVTPEGVRLLDDSDDALVAEEEAISERAASGMSLSLERDLERALVSRLDQLEAGLRLVNGHGTRGQQLDTGVVGRLDLLAHDQADRFVVIELKVGRADDKVVGQILRYMGWVKRELANGADVRGIIVASDFDDRIRYAVEAIPSVELKRYEINFSFDDA
jgi:hypothetical protein